MVYMTCTNTFLKRVSPLEDVQVVLSVGKNINPENLGSIPSNTIVVRSALQIELLKRAGALHHACWTEYNA
jgi:zeaxanthin glucosyltransferase